MSFNYIGKVNYNLLLYIVCSAKALRTQKHKVPFEYVARESQIYAQNVLGINFKNLYHYNHTEQLSVCRFSILCYLNFQVFSFVRNVFLSNVCVCVCVYSKGILLTHMSYMHLQI